MREKLAEPYVNLGLKKSDFDKGLRSAKSGLKSFEKDTRAIGASIKAGFAAIIGGGVALGMKDLLDTYAQQEKYERMLAAAMKERGTYTEAAMKHNMDYASSLQALTTYGDEAIMQAQRIFTNYRIEGEMLDQITKATLDLAAAKDMELASAAELVAKSVGSSTNSLSRYGIQIDGAAGSIDRMRNAVDAITKLYGGTAAAAADNYEGRVIQLTNAWGDMKEQLGALMIGPATQTVSWMKTATEEITAFIAKYQEWSSINSIAIRGLRSEIQTLENDLATFDPAIPGDQAVIERLQAEIKKRQELLKLYEPAPGKDEPAGAGSGAAAPGTTDFGVEPWRARQEAEIAIRNIQQETDIAVRESMKAWDEAGKTDWGDVEPWEARAASEAAVQQIIEDSDKAAAAANKSLNTMVELTERTANAMEQNYSDFFFNVLEGRFDNLKDVARAALSSINRMAADLLGQKFTDLLFGASTAGGVRSGGLFNSLFSSLTTMADGGTITEPIWGVGMSGRRYLFGEGGEREEVVPHSRIARAGGGGQAMEVRHHYEVTIVAADARSFTEMCMRNPEAITGPFRKALRAGDQGLIGDMRGVV